MTAITETIERLLKEANRAIEEGRPEDASPLAERARGLAEKAYGCASSEVADCLAPLAISQFQAGDYEASARTGFDLVRINESRLGREHLNTVGSLLQLGASLVAGSTPRAATDVFKRALMALEKNLSGSPYDYERAVRFIAEKYELRGFPDLLSFEKAAYGFQGQFRSLEE
ncbi:MAG: hypothetical protein EBT03_09570 [Betaproteobacteria bacterium]|nr:hypothetical protein [Betaproteobacteria bacterium]NCA17535.1 hypothetical protein [Betaproteobacteria bacterium]